MYDSRPDPFRCASVEKTMQYLITLLCLLLPSVSTSAELISVDDSGFCKSQKYNICYEWKFKSNPSLRYIAAGFEDGINYSVGKISPDGKMELLFNVNPIIVDHEGNRWWGYPWDTHDLSIDIRNNTIYLYADFEHQIKRDGEISMIKKQTFIPAHCCPDVTKQRHRNSL